MRGYSSSSTQTLISKRKKRTLAAFAAATSLRRKVSSSSVSRRLLRRTVNRVVSPSFVFCQCLFASRSPESSVAESSAVSISIMFHRSSVWTKSTAIFQPRSPPRHFRLLPRHSANSRWRASSITGRRICNRSSRLTPEPFFVWIKPPAQLSTSRALAEPSTSKSRERATATHVFIWAVCVCVRVASPGSPSWAISHFLATQPFFSRQA